MKEVNTFKIITAWSEDDYNHYDILLKEFYVKNKAKIKKKGNAAETDVITTEKGKALENIVNFIIEKSFLLDVYPNKHTASNEIEQFIVVSKYGKEAIHKFNFSPELLGFNNGYFLGECKNYYTTIEGTWVGKFYTLLKVCGNCDLGIIFSYYGLTGEEHNWNAAHGLTKTIYRIESVENKIFILDFNYKDFEKLADRINKWSIFDIINSKKLSLKSSAKSENLMQPHDSTEFIRNTKVEINDLVNQ